MLLAGFQTDTAELVCAVTGTAGPCTPREAAREKKKKGDQGGGKKPLVLPKAESERTETRPAGPAACFPCAFLSTGWVPTFSWGEALSVTAVWLSRLTERSEASSGCNVNETAQRDEEQRWTR